MFQWCCSTPQGSPGVGRRIWDLIISVPDHCLSFYFTYHYVVDFSFRYVSLSLCYVNLLFRYVDLSFCNVNFSFRYVGLSLWYIDFSFPYVSFTLSLCYVRASLCSVIVSLHYDNLFYFISVRHFVIWVCSFVMRQILR